MGGALGAYDGLAKAGLGGGCAVGGPLDRRRHLAGENQAGPNRARARPRHADHPEGDQRPEARPQKAATPVQRRVARGFGFNGVGASVMRHSCPTPPRRAMFS
jgi:hypothetical protein